jgi:hypothetical protein
MKNAVEDLNTIWRILTSLELDRIILELKVYIHPGNTYYAPPKK